MQVLTCRIVRAVQMSMHVVQVVKDTREVKLHVSTR